MNNHPLDDCLDLASTLLGIVFALEFLKKLNFFCFKFILYF